MRLGDSPPIVDFPKGGSNSRLLDLTLLLRSQNTNLAAKRTQYED